tara:strand:+ start:107 stop:685 length:579 start_codon:yes stop_codon:yes gene_type:complete
MQFAYIDAVQHLAHIAGASLYKYKLRRVDFQKIFYYGIFALVMLRLSQMVLITRINVVAHVPDLAFAMGEAIAFSIVGQVLIMPVCVIGARMCPKGIEGSLYSTLMSISNFGGLIASWLGAALTDAFEVSNQDFSNLWKLSFLCTVLSVIPVVFVHYMPRVSAVYFDNSVRHTGHDACSDTTHLRIQREQNT